MTDVPKHDEPKTTEQLQDAVDNLYTKLKDHRKEVENAKALKARWKKDKANKELTRDVDEYWTLTFEYGDAIMMERRNLNRYHENYMTRAQRKTMKDIGDELR